MKPKLLRILFAVAVFDLVLGAVLAVGIVSGIAGPRAWTGAGALLFFGALGILWFGRARRAAEVRP